MSAKIPAPTFLVLAAPALLLLTAGVQRIQVQSHDLNPWKGGGFGMFSDHHRTAYRVLRVAVVDAQGNGHITLTPVFRKERFEVVRTRPTRESLQALARELFEEKWVEVTPHRNPEKRYVVLEEEAALHRSSRPFQHIGIRLDLFQYEFDPETNTLAPRELDSVFERAGA